MNQQTDGGIDRQTDGWIIHLTIRVTLTNKPLERGSQYVVSNLSVQLKQPVEQLNKQTYRQLQTTITIIDARG